MPAIFDGLKLIDSDTHFSEPADLWVSRATSKYKDLVPQVAVRNDGTRHWVVGDRHLQVAGGVSYVDREGLKHGFTNPEKSDGRHWHTIHPASFDPGERVRLMDELGIWAHVVYPNVLGFAAPALLQTLDRDLAYAIVGIYNDAIAEWAAAGQRRLYPQAVLPFWDVAQSVKEAHRIRDMGLTGVILAGEPHLGGLPDLGQEDWYPLYEALTDLNLPINVHIGGSNVPENRQEREGDVVVGDFKTAWRSLEARAHKPVDSIQVELGNSRFMSNILMSDVLLRFPTLKWVSVESGIGWIPFVLERLDYEYRENIPGMPPPTRPSAKEMLDRNVFACFWFEHAGPIDLLDRIGPGNVMWETDFPHPSCLYPDPVDVSAGVLKDVPPDSLRQIMQDNAAGVYGIPLE